MELHHYDYVRINNSKKYNYKIILLQLLRTGMQVRPYNNNTIKVLLQLQRIQTTSAWHRPQKNLVP